MLHFLIWKNRNGMKSLRQALMSTPKRTFWAEFFLFASPKSIHNSWVQNILSVFAQSHRGFGLTVSGQDGAESQEERAWNQVRGCNVSSTYL